MDSIGSISTMEQPRLNVSLSRHRCSSIQSHNRCLRYHATHRYRQSSRMSCQQIQRMIRCESGNYISKLGYPTHCWVKSLGRTQKFITTGTKILNLLQRDKDMKSLTMSTKNTAMKMIIFNSNCIPYIWGLHEKFTMRIPSKCIGYFGYHQTKNYALVRFNQA